MHVASLLQINPDDHAEDKSVLHVQERLFMPAHLETSKFNNSASSHKLQTWLWPLTVALLYYNIHYTREFLSFLFISRTVQISLWALPAHLTLSRDARIVDPQLV